MKISISNIAWKQQQLSEMIKLFRGFNVDGLEIAPTMIWQDPYMQVDDNEIKSFRKYLLQNGLEVSALQSVLYGKPNLQIFKDDEVRKQMLSHLEHVFNFAAKLNARSVVFGSPKNRIRGDLEDSLVREIALQFFCQVGDLAKVNDIVLCIEPNPKEYACDFLTNTADVHSFVGLLNHPNVLMNIDVGAMILNQEDPKSVLKICQNEIGHLHISEPYLAQVGNFAEFHNQVADSLADIKYSGWVSIEMKSTPGEAAIHCTKESLSFVQTVYGRE